MTKRHKHNTLTSQNLKQIGLRGKSGVRISILALKIPYDPKVTTFAPGHFRVKRQHGPFSTPIAHHLYGGHRNEIWLVDRNSMRNLNMRSFLT